MENNQDTIKLSYAKCNLDSILCFTVIVPAMIVTIFIIKLFVDSDIYKDKRICSPISFFFGETNGCKRMIHNDATSVLHTEPFISSFTNHEVQNTLYNSSRVVVNINEKIKSFTYRVLKSFL